MRPHGEPTKTLSTSIYSGRAAGCGAVHDNRATGKTSNTGTGDSFFLRSRHRYGDNSDNNHKNDRVGVGVAVVTRSSQHSLTLSTYLVHVPLSQPQNSLCGGTAVRPTQRRVCGVLSHCASKVPNVWVKPDRTRRAWKGSARRGPCSHTHTHGAVRSPGRLPQLQVPPSVKCRHSHHRCP